MRKRKITGFILVLCFLAAPSAAAQDFAMLDAVKEAVGADHVMLVNQECLWKEAGAEQVLDVIPYFIEADYDRRALG